MLHLGPCARAAQLVNHLGGGPSPERQKKVIFFALFLAPHGAGASIPHRPSPNSAQIIAAPLSRVTLPGGRAQPQGSGARRSGRVSRRACPAATSHSLQHYAKAPGHMWNLLLLITTRWHRTTCGRVLCSKQSKTVKSYQ